MAVSTNLLTGEQVAARIAGAVPDAVHEATSDWIAIRPEQLLAAARFVHDDASLDARYLANLAAVDRYDHFEVAYHVASLSHNHAFTLKVRADHVAPELPSVSSVWLGAHLQEREAFDLLGISFSGHPDLKRIFLWEGFPGHPLRKDFMSLPGGFRPGLQRFPKEDPKQWGGEARVD